MRIVPGAGLPTQKRTPGARLAEFPHCRGGAAHRIMPQLLANDRLIASLFVRLTVQISLKLLTKRTKTCSRRRCSLRKRTQSWLSLCISLHAFLLFCAPHTRDTRLSFCVSIGQGLQKAAFAMGAKEIVNYFIHELTSCATSVKNTAARVMSSIIVCFESRFFPACKSSLKMIDEI